MTTLWRHRFAEVSAETKQQVLAACSYAGTWRPHRPNRTIPERGHQCCLPVRTMLKRGKERDKVNMSLTVLLHWPSLTPWKLKACQSPESSYQSCEFFLSSVEHVWTHWGTHVCEMQGDLSDLALARELASASTWRRSRRSERKTWSWRSRIRKKRRRHDDHTVCQHNR